MPTSTEPILASPILADSAPASPVARSSYASTVPEYMQVTSRRLLPGMQATAVGCSPHGTSAMTRPAARSTRDTELDVWFAVTRKRSSSVSTKSTGERSTLAGTAAIAVGGGAATIWPSRGQGSRKSASMIPPIANAIHGVQRERTLNRGEDNERNMAEVFSSGAGNRMEK